MSERMFILVTEGLDGTQNKLLLNVVQLHSTGWWHEMINVWMIKGGGTLQEWAPRISAITGLPSSSHLLLELPPEGSARQWSARLSSSSLDWLRETYYYSTRAIGDVVDSAEEQPSTLSVDD